VVDNPGARHLMARAGRIFQRFGLGLLSNHDGLIDWYAVSGTAIDVSGEDWSEAVVGADAAEEFAAYVDIVYPSVAELTGLTPAGPLRTPVVFNRSEWIVTTAANLKPLLELLLDGIMGTAAIAARGGGPTRILRAATSSEVGLVIGYLSGRVLGQYDAPLLDGAGARGAIYFIYPNILEAEKRLGLPSRDFRLWLALHEVTHAVQFEANPWIKDYLRELIEGQARYMGARLARDAGDGSAGHKSVDLPAKLLLTKQLRRLISPEENPLMAKAQAVMSVLEGYSEYVMETAGADMVDGVSGIADRLDDARRTRSGPHRLIERLIGLEVKIEQYRSGYLFIKQAAELGGMSLVNLVWQGPQSLPTLTELRQPELWMARMLKT